MKRYLTSQGLQTLWNQIKALFATKAELNQKASKTELNALSESVSASLSEIEQTDIRQDASISSLSENKADKTALSKLKTDTATALDKKVDKVSGMGLSHNDYTDEDKAKLDGIEENANNYSLPVAGSALGGVKSGGDITIQSDGTMQVNDDSHNHVIENVDGLQNLLDARPFRFTYSVSQGNSVSISHGTDYIASLIFLRTSLGGGNALVYFTTYGEGTNVRSRFCVISDGSNNIQNKDTANWVFKLKGRILYLKNNTQDTTIYAVSFNRGNVSIESSGIPSDAEFMNITFPNRAIADSLGHIIYETYATKTENNNKVDKVEGKGLSTNDYTTDEKNKLSGIASGAEVNTIVAVQRNGTAITPKDRVVNILVPVKTSELNNDSTYQTAADVAETIVGVKLDLASGIITLTRKNGTTFTLDLPTEKIIKSGYYDSKTKEIVLVLADESEIRFSASQLIDEYYADNVTLEQYTDTADGNKKKFRLKTAYKNKIDGSEQTTNKTASVSSSSTETQYPTAKAVYNAVKDLATKVQTFTQASARANIESGETISTIFGKIRKWFADLKAVAFSASYSDLIDKPTLDITDEGDSDVTDNTFIVTSRTDGLATNKTIYRRPATFFWNYIKDKISSVLGLTASAYSGVANYSNNIRGNARNRNNNSRYIEIGRISIPTVAYADNGVSLYVKGHHNSNFGDSYIFNVTLGTNVNASPYAEIYCVMASRTNYNEVLVGELTSTHLILYLDCVLQNYCRWTFSKLSDVYNVLLYTSGNVYAASVPANGGTKVPQSNKMLATMDGCGAIITDTYRKLSGVLELTDSNIATYFNSSTGVLTIPNGVTTILFNTNYVQKVFNIIGTCAVNGYRLSIAGRWQPAEKTSSSTTGCFSSYIYGYRGGAVSYGTQYSSEMREAFEDFIYFNGVWYSKAY